MTEFHVRLCFLASKTSYFPLIGVHLITSLLW